ncbi:MAG: hypothetical protein KDE59_31215 [Anaerolineales bacterium]|nr:hypothetical protein [Anaerolineales bacterium]
MSDHSQTTAANRFALLQFMHPREQTGQLIFAALMGLFLGWIGMQFYDWPLWIAAGLTLGLLVIPSAGKWRADLRRYGRIAMGVSFLLMTQGFHTIEHLVQWYQYYQLSWTARNAVGLLSPANNEWVHFTWNWLVVIVILVLVRLGWRNPWSWLLLIWALAHTLEHSYMFVRFLQVEAQLNQLGVPEIAAQGLPGILGKGGWLAQSHWTSGTFLSRLPGLATAERIEVHFWWNVGEMLLLLLASHVYIRSLLREYASK